MIQNFVPGITIVQPSIASTVSASSQSQKTNSIAQADRTKHDAFIQELDLLSKHFLEAVKNLAYRRRDGSKGLACSGSGYDLEDRRTYIDQLIARNMYLLTRGSAEYNAIIRFQNDIAGISYMGIQACDYRK